MAEVIDFEKAKKGGKNMDKKKPSIKELETRLSMIEGLVGQLQGALQGITNELFQANANGVTMFRALEKKGTLTEADIEASWDENIVKPYEEAEVDKKQNATNEGEAPTIIT